MAKPTVPETDWSDSEDEFLAKAADELDKDTVLKATNQRPNEIKTQTPLEAFRPGYLWVSDFTRQNWCERQLFYSFTVPTIAVENPVMTEGSNLHLARELAVHDVVSVKVSSNEDVWGIKVLNLLTSIQVFLNNGTIAREVPIFGAPFGEDIFVVGLIDELRFDPDTFQVDLQELKTRKYSSFPSKSQQSQHRLQVMLYKKLFDDLVKGQLAMETVAKHLRLNLQQNFGSDVQGQIDSKMFVANNLQELMSILFQKMQCFTLVNELSIEYVHQETKVTLFHHPVSYEEDELSAMFRDYLKFWRGQRESVGVDIEEAWKCQSCDFADVCDWRKRKAEEYSKKNCQKC